MTAQPQAAGIATIATTLASEHPPNSPAAIAVPYWTSGVRGLIITYETRAGGLQIGSYVLTHKASGYRLPRLVAASVADARRMATRLKTLAPDVGWTVGKESIQDRFRGVLVDAIRQVAEEQPRPAP